MRTPLSVAIMCLATVPTTVVGEEIDPHLDCRLGFTGLLDFVGVQPGIKTEERDRFMQITVPGEKVTRMYAFTAETHYAFPTVILRTIYEDSEGVKLRRTACGYGDEAKFDKVMAEFEELDAQNLERLQNGLKGGN